MEAAQSPGLAGSFRNLHLHKKSAKASQLRGFEASREKLPFSGGTSSFRMNQNALACVVHSLSTCSGL
jgi:hypothetical protein